MTVSFGGFNLDAGAYKVQSATGPFSETDREMLGAEFARRAGGRLLAVRYQSRTITIEGSVSGTTIDNLRANWVALALALSKEAQQLKVHLDSTDRYYVATKQSLSPGGTTTASNRLWTPYVAVFDVATPFALAAAASQDIQTDKLLSLVAGSEYKYAWTVAPGGTVYCEPKFTITLPASALLAEYGVANEDGELGFGAGASWWQYSHGFKPTATTTVGRVRLRLRKSGAPADNVYATINTDDGTGKPSAVVLGTSDNVAASKIPIYLGWINFYFGTPPSVTSGVQYHIVVKRTGAIDASNFYFVGCDTSGAYADGQACRGTNADVWTAFAAIDLIFAVREGAAPWGMTKLWVLNNSLSPPLKLAVIETFEASDSIVIDCEAFTAEVNAVRAINTEGAYPVLDPRVTNNALEVHALADSAPTLSVTTDWRARYLS